MRTGVHLIVFGIVAALSVVPGATGSPPKAPATPDQVREYRNSGEWDRDIAVVDRRAKAWLKKRMSARRPPRKAALVLDIDETSLDNYPCIDAGDFLPQTLVRLLSCELRYDAPAVEQTRSLFRRARKLKLAVFFVTGRREALREGTRRNLRTAGYSGGSGLLMRPDDDMDPSVVPFKSSARRKIEKRGFTILANVGDQRSDLAGGHAKRRFLLPNPMYVLP